MTGAHRWILAVAIFSGLVGCHRRPAAETAVRYVPASAGLSVPVVAAIVPFRAVLRDRPIYGSAVTLEQVNEFLSLLSREYSIYPSEFLRATKLERIVLCRHLSFNGQLRAAVPDFEHNVLYVDVERGNYDSYYQRRVLHHELFHVIDWQDDGQLYEDRAWRGLNSDSFRYGNGGTAAQLDPWIGSVQAFEPGFLTRYSMTGVEEDKAELFSLLMVSPQHVLGRAEQDQILADKVARLKELLQTFCPALNTSFWQRVEARDPAESHGF